MSFAVISSGDGDKRTARSATRDNPTKPNKKTLPAVIAGKAFRVETTGIEPATSGLQIALLPNAASLKTLYSQRIYDYGLIRNYAQV